MLFRLFVLFTVIYITTGNVIEKPVDFSKHQVIRILPNKLDQLDELENIRAKLNLDFWNHPLPDLRPVLTLVGPEQTQVLKALNSSNIKYEVAFNNYQKVIDDERADYLRSKEYFAAGFDYENSYHTYDDIKAELKRVAASNSHKATYESIGKTHEGRDIPALVITNASASPKKAVFLECGIHAREWISTAFCLNTINKLITDSTYDHYLNKFKFIIVPTVNADGYVYTWTTNRSWRKTRTVNGNCVGADPNRNWDDSWNTAGASPDPCSDLYSGKAPFSEPCSKAMADRIAKESGNIAAYFAFHSFSQLWMWPFGYKTTLAPNNAQLETLSKNAVTAIKAVNGLTFNIGNIAKAIYLASGSSVDWAYDKHGAKVAFAVELRDKGQFGFNLPANQIHAACLETIAGVKTVLNSI